MRKHRDRFLVLVGITGWAGILAIGAPAGADLTPVPRVLSSPAGAVEQAPEFPALRQYTGAPAAEATTIRMATDGQTLFARIRAPDAHPEQLVMRVSAASNYPAIWKEDSLELFFKPAPDYPEQFQFIISCSGHYVQNHNRHLADARYERMPWPDKERATVKVQRHAGGYDVELTVPLASMAFKTPLKVGDRIYGQLVRNYRGHGDPDREVLQLFPSQIYIGANAPPSNHHPQGFQPLVIVAAE